MTDFLDDLLPALKGNIKTHHHPHRPDQHTLEEPTNFHRLAKQPDALVLAMIRTKCQNCGLVTEYPSQWLLYRFGKSYSWTTSSVESDAHLPLEIRTMEIENAYCRTCFPAGATEVNHRDGSDQPGASQPNPAPERTHETA